MITAQTPDSQRCAASLSSLTNLSRPSPPQPHPPSLTFAAKIGPLMKLLTLPTLLTMSATDVSLYFQYPSKFWPLTCHSFSGLFEWLHLPDRADQAGQRGRGPECVRASCHEPEVRNQNQWTTTTTTAKPNQRSPRTPASTLPRESREVHNADRSLGGGRVSYVIGKKHFVQNFCSKNFSTKILWLWLLKLVLSTKKDLQSFQRKIWVLGSARLLC